MQNIKAIFDIGNGFIKGAVFAQDEGKNVVLLKDIVKTKGMRKGKILDSEDFIISINSLIEAFAKKLGGEFIDEIYLGISHPEMLISRVNEQKRIMTDIIKNDDIEHLSRIVSEISQKNDFEILKILPVYWLIDENKKEKDPVGLQGKKLELVADIFYIPKNFYNNLIEVFDKLNIGIVDIVPNILAASEVALDFDLKDLGTILIDIGTNQTSFVVYEEGYPLTYGVIGIGGEDVTKDVSICMQMDIKEAEDTKKEKGFISCYEEQKLSANTEAEIGYLTKVITARYEEIFNKIQKSLHKIGKDGRLPGGVILIGGGAKIENIDILAKGVFKLASFYGKDNNLNLGDLSNNLQFINAIGNYVRFNKYAESKRPSIKFNFDFLSRIGKFIKEIF